VTGICSLLINVDLGSAVFRYVNEQEKEIYSMKPIKTMIAAMVMTAILVVSTNVIAVDSISVRITRDLPSLDVMHNGKMVTIMRNQDQKNTINPAYTKTSRECPPFCIQPYTLAPGIETIGEVEMLDYLAQVSAGDNSILVVDSRTPDWVKKGTIPGSVNIPWTSLSLAEGADQIAIREIMEDRFGAKYLDELWDYTNAKTLVMFCNGIWCSQSPNNILNLLKFGYPAHNIKWYRGGMQDWEILGLTTVPGK
jgi:rhodanese-related sulfurtransferase